MASHDMSGSAQLRHAAEGTEPATATVQVTVGRETRTIEIDPWPDREGRLWRAAVGGVVAVIGRGSARYPATLLLDRFEPGDRPRPGTTRVTDSLGRTWTYHLQTCVRNRQARITGWADTAGVTNDVDQTRRTR